ncbi:MAG: radical SAM protein [Candidatus Bathyarchaeia archaeon]|nr:radical SAM protein [Candidatus Bathyarchaeota archaeon]
MSVEVFLSFLRNPLIRPMIRSSISPKNRRNYLESALNGLVGNKTSYSLNEIIFSRIIGLVLNLGFLAFDIDKKDAINSLKIPYFRNGLFNVLDSIGKYGVNKPLVLSAPFLVVWNYTNACNLKCKHCYQSADKPSPDELTTEESFRIVDQLSESKVSAIAFSGGEPLIREDLFRVARYAHDRGLYVSIATNGTLLTDNVVEELKQSRVDYIEISLDSSREENHDTFRGVRGAFKRTMEGIKNAVEKGFYTCIAITATKNNINEIPDMIDIAKKIGIKRVIVFNFIPTGRGKEIEDLDLSPIEREDLLKYLYMELVEGRIEVLSTAPQYSRVCLQQSIATRRGFLAPTHFAALDLHGRTKRLADFIGGCGAGRLYCAIQPNGQVTPCVFMPIVVGDLRKQSLREVWLNSGVMNDLRDRKRLKGRCRNCKYRDLCGGCRARAYAYYGDYLAPDPGCIRELEEPSTQFSIISAKPSITVSSSRNPNLKDNIFSM